MYIHTHEYIYAEYQRFEEHNLRLLLPPVVAFCESKRDCEDNKQGGKETGNTEDGKRERGDKEYIEESIKYQHILFICI